jgi:hypothetical protein
LATRAVNGKTTLPFVPAVLYGCPDVIDATLCVTVNTFVVLNLSTVPIAVELFAGTSFDPINISAEKVVILCPELIHHLCYKMINLPKEIML